MSVTAASTARQKWIMAVLLAVQFMLILDVAVVSVALPRIQEDLHVGAANLQWVSTAYTLTFGGLLVLAGRAGDMLGRRQMFLAGVALFTVSSLLCGLAVQDWQLFAARAVQGVGAALVSPAALSLLTTSFADPSQRNRALGLWGAVASGGAIVGQVVGGVLTDTWGWRWVFLVNLPVGVLALAAAVHLVPRDGAERRGSLDSFGALTLTLGTLLAVFGISQVAERGFDQAVLGSFAVAAVSFALFARRERRHPEPLVRFGVFRNRSLVGGNLVSILNAVAATAAIFFSTLYMQHVLGYSPFAAGLAFVPVTGAILVVSGQTGRLVARFGVRALLAGGALLTLAGLTALLLTMAVGGGYWTTVLPGLMLLGIGQGLAFAPGMIAATDGVADEEQGLASGLVTTSQQLGGAVGFAILATAAAAALPAATAGPAALVHSYRVGYLAGLVVPVLAFVAALALTRGRSAGPGEAPAAGASPAEVAATGAPAAEVAG